MKLSIILVLFGISHVFGSSEFLEETETNTSCLPPFEFAAEFENVFKTGFCAIQIEILGKKTNLTDCEKCHMAKATIEDQSFEFEMASHFATLYTGKSLLEALIFASTNPQYDDRLFIELQVQYMKIPSSNLGRTCCVQKLFLTFRTIFVHNMFSPGFSLEFSCVELVIK